MSSINVNDGSINFGTKSLNEFSDAENLSDFTHVLALKQDGNIGVRMAIDNFLNKLSQEGGFATLEDLGNKQNTLVSGTNIKTINGVNILSSGDLLIGDGISLNDNLPSFNSVYSSARCNELFAKNNPSPFSFLETKYSLTLISNPNWLLADGSWLDRYSYPDVWNEIIDRNNVFMHRGSVIISEGEPSKHVYFQGGLATDRTYDAYVYVDYQTSATTVRKAGTCKLGYSSVRGKYYIEEAYLDGKQYDGSLGVIDIDTQNDKILTVKGIAKKVEDDYTDYDFVINVPDDTFRLPTKPLPRVLVETGSNFLFHWEIYSDGYCRLRGATGRSVAGYATINLPFKFKGYFDRRNLLVILAPNKGGATDTSSNAYSLVEIENRATENSITYYCSTSINYVNGITVYIEGYLKEGEYTPRPNYLYYYIGE